ncbi:MAG: PadR family transcriptional regulator [Candidatus Bathyarchaeia archaeon]
MFGNSYECHEEGHHKHCHLDYNCHSGRLHKHGIKHHGHHHRRGNLRTWVLSILQQAPRNGYEIINQIEFASEGEWRPSPGSVYPLLAELCKEGSIRKREDGRYEITEKGRKELEWLCGMPTRQRQSLDEILTEMSGYLSYLEDLKRVDPSKIASSIDKLRSFKDRLAALIEVEENVSE